MANTEILQQVSDGYRMPCPNNCPSVIYAVMLRTWEEDPNKRPSFASLRSYFEDYFAAQAEEEEEAVEVRQHHHNSEEEAAPQQHQFLLDRARRSGYPFMASPARLETSSRSSPRQMPRKETSTAESVNAGSDDTQSSPERFLEVREEGDFLSPGTAPNSTFPGQQ
ncbi:hypothetical protein SprV_0200537100 [Sparganum proliferum]